MKIKLTIDFSPDIRYKVDSTVVCYFYNEHQMYHFLATLDSVSNKRYEYKWKEIKAESEY